MFMFAITITIKNTNKIEQINSRMKLSRKGLKAIDTPVRVMLAYELKKSESTINRWIKNNHVNLTTEAALRIIEKETGLSRGELLTSK